MRIFATAIAVLAITASAAISAEDHKHQGQHGGVVVESGHHHLEIVAKDGVLEVYVNGEDGKPEDVKDAKASAAILSGGKKVDVQLAPSGENVLKGGGAFTAAKGTVIIVTLTMLEHEPEQARVKLD